MNQDEFKAREVCMTSLSHNSIQIDNKAYTFCQKAIDVGDIKWDTSEEDITTCMVTTMTKVSFNLW